MTTPKVPASWPPRVWHNMSEINNPMFGLGFCIGMNSSGYFDTEYISRQEHESIVADAVREARALAFEDAANIVLHGFWTPDRKLYERIMDEARAARAGEKR